MIDIVAWVSSNDSSSPIPSDRRFRLTLAEGKSDVMLRDREGQLIHTFSITSPPVHHRDCYIFNNGDIEYRATLCSECTRNLKDEFDDYIGDL